MNSIKGEFLIMENKDLFQRVQDGYSCEQVEQYITVLKTEYKKVFEYAKATEANNEKLKSICRSLSEENKALKAGAAAPSDSTGELTASVERIASLCEQLANENAALYALISK